jgi:hypothetical protein
VTVPVRAQDATPMASPIAMNGPFSSIIDLSHTWHEDFPMYPGAQQPESPSARSSRGRSSCSVAGSQ